MTKQNKVTEYGSAVEWRIDETENPVVIPRACVVSLLAAIHKCKFTAKTVNYYMVINTYQTVDLSQTSFWHAPGKFGTLAWLGARMDIND